MAHVPRIREALRDVLETALPYPPEILIAQYGPHAAALQGAMFGSLDALKASPRSRRV